MTEPTRAAWVTVGADVGEVGADLVARCAELDRRLSRARPDIEWSIAADLRCPTSTIKVEPDWPANYAEVNALVGPELVRERNEETPR